MIRENAFGPEHPHVARSLNGLATLYADQGQYAKADPLYQRALTILEKALGAEHSDVVHRLNNLALLYETQGQYAKAEPLFERTQAIYERTISPYHPNLAKCLEKLRAHATKHGPVGRSIAAGSSRKSHSG